MQRDAAIERLRKALREHRQQVNDLLINAENLEVALIILEESHESIGGKKVVNSDCPESRLVLQP